MKYQDVVNILRNEIQLGQLSPGQRLPTWTELQQRFGTTRLTVQRAMDVLVQDGYIRTRDRSGTFVVDHPPHLAHYALAFPYPADYQNSHFITAIRNEAVKRQRPDLRISLFHEINGHRDVEDYQRFLQCVQAQRVAGVIYAFPTMLLRGTPLWDNTDVPRVAISSLDAQAIMPVIYPNGNQFLPLAIERLAALGRKRLAVLFIGGDGEDPLASKVVIQAQQLARQYGLELPEHCIQGVHAHTRPWARQVVMSLMAAAPEKRPDALIITDDNLLEAATAGLVAMQINVPEEMMVIAHTNYPWPTQSHVPVMRLGFDITRLVTTCIELINRHRHGETVPPATWIPPFFEDTAIIPHPLPLSQG